MDLVMSLSPLFTMLGWFSGLIVFGYMEAKRERKEADQEIRYLEAVAMLTAEEKREIGIE